MHMKEMYPCLVAREELCMHCFGVAKFVQALW